MTDAPMMLTANEAAALMSISRKTVYRLMSDGRFPAPIHLGRCVRWRREELTAWVEAGCPPRVRWEVLRKDTP